MKSLLSFISAIVLLAAVGCETKHTFSVNALSSPTAPMGEYKTFALAAGSDAPDSESLAFQEAMRYANTALISEGFREADSADTADLIVELSFSVSKPQTTVRERSEPVYGYVGGGYHQRLVKVKDKHGKVSTQVVYSYSPRRQQLIGWDRDFSAQTVFEKSLTLHAYSTESTDSGDRLQEVWMVEVRNRNGSEDLRYYIPRMLAAALDYIDRDSGSMQRVQLAESDPRISMILAQGY